MEVIKTPRGNLLVDGFFRYARKIQYTGDILQALAWGMVCGWSSTMPYFCKSREREREREREGEGERANKQHTDVIFFTTMICHRQWRDEEKCSRKYGKFWEECEYNTVFNQKRANVTRELSAWNSRKTRIFHRHLEQTNAGYHTSSSQAWCDMNRVERIWAKAVERRRGKAR